MMREKYFNILRVIFICCIFTIGSYSKAQSINKISDANSSDRYVEKISIITDREIYISGEQVWIKVYKLNGLTGTPDDLSKVVYVELLDTQFNPLNQLKVLVTGTSGSACIRLSDTLSSGNYFIRAYTKWMLNSASDRDVYKPLFILNPFKNINNFLTSSNGSSGANSNDQIIRNSGINNYQSVTIPDDRINIKISPFTGLYGQREKVGLNINTTDNSGKPVSADLSVSIVRTPLTFSEGMGNFPGYLSDTISGYFKGSQGRLPELEGEFVTGTIRNILSGEPLQNAEVSLSFVGKTSKCIFSRTNYNGEFLFVVKDQYGPEGMVIQPLSKDIRDVYVELDQPFSTVFDNYSFQFPSIDSSRIEGINKAIIGMQVSSVYDLLGKTTDQPSENTSLVDFYGTPTRRVNIAEFIELTDIREVVKELLPEVAVLNKNKKIGLKVINRNPYESFEDQALVLIDGVPSHDIEALLKVPSKEFERIDIIDTKYFYRDFIFEGIVNFVTKKGNEDILESDNPVFRQIYEGYQKESAFYMPDYSTDSLKTVKIPDFRNTLLWAPDITTGKEGTAQVQFYTSDEGGAYTIIIEGITPEGIRGVARVPLTVK